MNAQMNITLGQVYDRLAEKLGKEEARVLSEYIELKQEEAKEGLLTAEDFKQFMQKFETKQEDRFDRVNNRIDTLTYWSIGLQISTLVAVVVALLGR